LQKQSRIEIAEASGGDIFLTENEPVSFFVFKYPRG